MQIYEKEILDNVADAIKANNSIAIVSPISESHDFDGELSDSLSTALASIGVDKPVQSDLYYLSSVLVSAGWNKNDDVFSVSDLWSARHTPVDKPFNYMHDETDIIGHMTASAIMGPNGEIIEEEENLPDKVDIITSAVIYKSWGDQTARSRISEMIAQIEAGELAVSMEVFFKNFDYALITPEGEHKVIARSEESSFLTKHLRSYGGSGEYCGYRVGRLLRSFYFTGKGLVDKPANPRSIIFREANPFNPTKADITFFSTAMEVDMELEQLKAALDVAKAQAQTLETTNTDLNSAIAEKDSTIASLEVKVKELEDAIASISNEKTSLSQELQKMVAEAKCMKRRVALREAGADDAKADELVTKFADASDEMFASVLTLIVKPCEKEEDEEDEDETEALENVEVTEASVQVTEDEEDPTAKALASAADWFRNSVLKTTQNK